MSLEIGVWACKLSRVEGGSHVFVGFWSQQESLNVLPGGKMSPICTVPFEKIVVLWDVINTD